MASRRPSVEAAILQALQGIAGQHGDYTPPQTIMGSWTGAVIEEIHNDVRNATRIPAVLSVEEIQQCSIFNPDVDGSWYDELESSGEWDRLYDYWINPLNPGGLPRNAAMNVGNINDEILSHSWNPNGDRDYLWKGMVVGNVQSGKTATYTGLIAKAVDAGYRIIVVLTGMLDSLRAQTQGRIVRELVGSGRIPGTINRSEEKEYFELTWYRPGENGDDFQRSNFANIAGPVNVMTRQEDTVMIAVIKKNPHIMSALNTF